MSEEAFWPARRLRAIDWLVNQSGEQPFADSVFAQVCSLLLEDGVQMDRVNLFLRVLHPQFAGARFSWRPELGKESELTLQGHEISTSPRFLNSPIKALYEGADGIRQRLDVPPGQDEYAIFAELRDEGFTDYLALPVQFTDGKRHALTLATRRPGGFQRDELMAINEIIPLLSLAIEVRANRRMMRNLLNTYVGEHAGERILAGEIRRGTGMTLRAAIWYCDLRGFTEISEQSSRDAVIEWLNEYFDVMSEPVQRHGGEILKFMGDAMLAVFPVEQADACWRALQAAVDARQGMRELNARRVERGQHSLGFGVALHLGDVMYGNIGTANRLDFTVIGPAVNVASRMQELTKTLRTEILLSGTFAAASGCNAEFLTPLGRFPLRGVQAPVEVFGVTGAIDGDGR